MPTECIAVWNSLHFCTETVALDSRGQIYAVDSSNFLRRGRHVGTVAVFEDEPLLHLGPGRGLALEFDADGNLVVCMAGAVSLVLPPCHITNNLMASSQPRSHFRKPCARLSLSRSCSDSCVVMPRKQNTHHYSAFCLIELIMDSFRIQLAVPCKRDAKPSAPVQGLYKVEMATLRLTLLTARVSPDSQLQPDTAIAYAEDLDIAADGTIYFTDATDIPVVAPEYHLMRPVDLSVFEVELHILDCQTAPCQSCQGQTSRLVTCAEAKCKGFWQRPLKPFMPGFLVEAWADVSARSPEFMPIFSPPNCS